MLCHFMGTYYRYFVKAVFDVETGCQDLPCCDRWSLNFRYLDQYMVHQSVVIKQFSLEQKICSHTLFNGLMY